MKVAVEASLSNSQLVALRGVTQDTYSFAIGSHLHFLRGLPSDSLSVVLASLGILLRYHVVIIHYPTPGGPLNVRGVHSAHTKYAVRGTDSKDEFITTDFTNF